MEPAVALSIVGPDEIALVGRLFGSARTTRHCWCTAFCSTRTQFAVGWFGGGNRRRFERLAAGSAPMGVVASIGSTPVGWAACGPRSRFSASPAGSRLLGARPADEDDTTWMLPCLFIHPQHRGQGISHALVDGVAAVARQHEAVALESWPLSASGPASGRDAGPDADAFVGREGLFAERGFRGVGRPVAERVIMRLDLR